MGRKRANGKLLKEVRACYQRGEGSCRELGERFGLTPRSVTLHCAREKWRVKKVELEKRVSQKVEEVLVGEATDWVKDTIKRGWKARREIDESKNQMAPAVDPIALDALSRVEVRFDDMVRKAFGLPDTMKHEVNGSMVINVVDPYSVPVKIDKTDDAEAG